MVSVTVKMTRDEFAACIQDIPVELPAKPCHVLDAAIKQQILTNYRNRIARAVSSDSFLSDLIKVDVDIIIVD